MTADPSPTRRIFAEELHRRLRGTEEMALVDVRDGGVFFGSHLLHAGNVPLARLEMDLPALVPRRETPVVLCDGGEHGCALAERAGSRLAGWGYRDLAVLDGGVEGWRAAGLELFSGVNVPSKAFGEFVELTSGTPHVEAKALAARLAAGEDIVILDSRPFDEYHRMNIPGGIDAPGAELVYRLAEVAPDPTTTVIVNCAGRTRSIIGAQSLINAGVPNPVAALKDGTMGWELAGLELARGRTERAPEPGPAALARARAAADRVAERYGVRGIDHATLENFRRDGGRTLYLMDVRPPEAYEDGHLPGSRSAPGGQLVQATDEYMGVRKARVVLVDDARVRAVMTASWLIQMGWDDVYVLDAPFDGHTLATGPEERPRLGWQAAETVSARDLKAALETREAIAVVDLGDSRTFRRGHVPGAWWGVRTRLERLFERVPRPGLLVLTSPDGVLAHYAAREVAAREADLIVRVLEGGTEAWRAAGYRLEEGIERATTEIDDVWYKPYDTPQDVHRRMQEYLDWEVALVGQIERDGTAEFRTY